MRRWGEGDVTLSLPELEALGSAYRAEQARRSLLAFLPYVRIPDPPPAGVGIVAFETWPHILRLHAAAEAVPPGGVLPVLKSRKLGVTSYFEARFMHMSQYRPGAFIPVISQGEKEAMKVIADCKFIWEHLPSELRADLAQDNLTTLKFKGGGTIEAFPATSKATRSYTGTEVLMDEADFHERFQIAYDSSMPLIQDTGGRMFLVSTANPEQVDSPFRQLYQREENRLFLGYFDRPGRTQEGYDSAQALASDESNFEKENARTEEEALAVSRAMAYFDVDILGWMMQNTVQEPYSVVGALSMWKAPAVGRHYILSGDTAWGKTGSYSAISVDEWETAEQVAELHGRLHPNELAYEIFELHKRYNHAFTGLERAGEGQERDGDSVVVVDKVRELMRDCSCQHRLYYHDHERDDPKTPGWVTDSRSRPFMLGEFREAVRERQVTIRSRGGIGEMMSFVRGDDGRPEASKGAFDDRPMCYAVAWQMRKYAKFAVRAAAPPSRVSIIRRH